MTIDFLIGAIRASRDLHPQVKTELEERLHRGAGSISEESAIEALQSAGWIECDYNCEPFAMVKRQIGRIEAE